jgi:tetratricopeptide (TPR) repeat protein
LGVALAAYGLALLSKETGLALLPPVLCLAWVSRADQSRRPSIQGGEVVGVPGFRWDLPRVGSFLGLSVAFVLMWRSMVGGVAPASSDGAAYPFWTFLEIMVRGVGLWFWPWPLGLDHPITFAREFDAMLAVVCVGVLGLIAWFAVRSFSRAPFIAWIVVWIVSGFLPLLLLPWLTTLALLQENRLSFSAVGLAWLTAWMARFLWTRITDRFGSGQVVRGVGLGLAAVAISGAVAIDRSRSWIWSDDARLWEEAVRRRPDDPVASANLGSVYYVRGALGPAEQAFQRALGQDPDYLWAALHLGLIYSQRRQWDAAADVLAGALERSSEVGEGASRGARGAAGRHPGDVQKIRMALGYVYLSRGELPKAQELYQEATRVDSTDFRAWYNLGMVAEQRGLIETARDAYRRAFALSPNEPQISAAVRRLDVER